MSMYGFYGIGCDARDDRAENERTSVRARESRVNIFTIPRNASQYSAIQCNQSSMTAGSRGMHAKHICIALPRRLAVAARASAGNRMTQHRNVSNDWLLVASERVACERAAGTDVVMSSCARTQRSFNMHHIVSSTFGTIMISSTSSQQRQRSVSF